MNRLLILVLIPLVALISCGDDRDLRFPGAPPGADTRLRSLLNVGSLGGQYQTPPNAKSAALIVRFFEDGKQVGRGPLVRVPIDDRTLDCEFLFQGNKAKIFTAGMATTNTNDIYEKVGKSWSNTSSGDFSELNTYKEVQILGFVTSGLDKEGNELDGTPDFNYHLENATHIVALFGILSEKGMDEVRNLSNQLESMPLGLDRPEQE